MRANIAIDDKNIRHIREYSTFNSSFFLKNLDSILFLKRTYKQNRGEQETRIQNKI